MQEVNRRGEKVDQPVAVHNEEGRLRTWTKHEEERARMDIDPYDQHRDEHGDDYMEYKSMSWVQAGALICAETIALGLLSFPLTFYRLGLFGGIFATVALAGLAWWTGYVLVKFKEAHPGVMNFADAGRVIGGRFGYALLGGALILKVVLLAGSHALSGAIALNNISSHAICSVAWAAIIAVVSFILTIPRTFSSASYISFVSVTSILVASFITMIAVAVQDHPQAQMAGDPGVQYKAFNYLGFKTTINAVTNIIFAYGGHGARQTPLFTGIVLIALLQVAIFSFASEMKKPADFKYSLALVQILATLVYILIGTVVYIYGGQYVTSPALSMASKAIRITSYSIALISIIVAGVVASYVGGKFIYFTLFRNSPILTSRGARAWLYWCLIMAGIWSLAFVIAEVIPFFSDLLSVISSILTIWFTYGLSGVLYWYDMRSRSERKYFKEGFFGSAKATVWSLLSIFVFIFAATFMVLGLYASISDIAEKYQSGDYGPPFSCQGSS